MKQAPYLMVSGKVQGVGFRYFAQMTAADHSVSGWVKNLDNGAVAIHAEGTPEQMNAFIAALKKGNHFTHVHHIEETSVPYESFTSFRIQY
ncbi:acylphosphatase [Domibacillus robiginosus]|uniref:acylphosphatase n=1 Tax=Domibacillus robiginosus TaxID=1071054 RepID=UPI00067CBD72|nr:acylphosphatase [Domibacillus robiginosus]